MDNLTEVYKNTLLELLTSLENKITIFKDTLSDFEEQLESSLRGRAFRSLPAYINLSEKVEEYNANFARVSERVMNFEFEDNGDFEEYVQVMDSLKKLRDDIDADFEMLEKKLW